MESLDRPAARRLALARAGLLNPSWTGLGRRAAGAGIRARSACLELVDRFGYLQLDTVSIAGARSHSLVLLSRLQGLDPVMGECLLQPGEPLFEYWGHAASWIPLELYPHFEFRRRAYRGNHWTGALLAREPKMVRELLGRIRAEGPLRSVDLEGKSGGGGWWDFKATKRVANALWSVGDLAIRERSRFQRTYDLPDRVLPANVIGTAATLDESLRKLLRRALDGHGWATTSTLARTWNLRNLRREIATALAEMQEADEVLPCRLDTGKGSVSGWIRGDDLELSQRLRRVRPPDPRGVLLSPFDPVLWDRDRVDLLFGFHQILEIFKPEPARRYGYFCLPVLAGEHLVARVDLKAHRRQSRLEIIAAHFEPDRPNAKTATRDALERYSHALEMELDHARHHLSR
ncbi:MAG: crosslink repair DNA glycosylase YcaQ family protein [Acidobacteriota bacterium]|nr:crosslink repair DNA glycosylase YcaQ family protein [Acidobacteriota bacterium]